MSCHIGCHFASSRISNITPVSRLLYAGEYYSAQQSIYMRLSREGLDQLRTHGLTERDFEIIASLDNCRLLTTNHIFRLHFPNTDKTSYRSCTRTLDRLYKAKILNRVNRRIGGINGGSNSHIYGLGLIGARLIGKNRLSHYSENISPYFIDHTLALSEIYVKLIENSGKYPIKDLQNEPYCWRSFTYGFGITEILKPDMYLQLINPKKKLEYYWFIEMDMATTHTPAIRKKAEIYQKYFQSNVEQNKNNVFPRVIWIVPDKKRQESLNNALDKINKAGVALNVVVTQEDCLSALTGLKPP
jgi:hypothetical protein